MGDVHAPPAGCDVPAGGRTGAGPDRGARRAHPGRRSRNLIEDLEGRGASAIHHAEDLGSCSALTGEALEPVLSHTAAAQRRGEIGAEHVKIIRRFFDRLPAFVDHHTREAAEADLAQVACGLKPEELHQVADRSPILLDQDGQLSDGDRARRRDQRSTSRVRTG